MICFVKIDFHYRKYCPHLNLVRTFHSQILYHFLILGSRIWFQYVTNFEDLWLILVKMNYLVINAKSVETKMEMLKLRRSCSVHSYHSKIINKFQERDKQVRVREKRMISIIVFLRNQMINVRKTKKERYDILIIKLTSQTLTGIVNQSVDFGDG